MLLLSHTERTELLLPVLEDLSATPEVLSAAALAIGQVCPAIIPKPTGYILHLLYRHISSVQFTPANAPQVHVGTASGSVTEALVAALLMRDPAVYGRSIALALGLVFLGRQAEAEVCAFPPAIVLAVWLF